MPSQFDISHEHCKKASFRALMWLSLNGEGELQISIYDVNKHLN